MESTVVSQSDRELAEIVVRSGAETAFRELYARHTEALYRFCLRMLGGSTQDAEEVVQETWVKALRGLGRFEWRSALRSWLTGIALNECRRMLRVTSKHDHSNDIDHIYRGWPDPGHRLDLEAALKRLPEGYRSVLLLHDLEGFKHEEIGKLLGISPGTSKSQLSRGRRMMRELLTGHAPEREACK